MMTSTLGYLYNARDYLECDMRDPEIEREVLLKITEAYGHVAKAIAVLEGRLP